MSRARRAPAFLALAAAFALAGCAPVAPWERGHLAKPQMALEPHPAQRALRAHVYASREGAAAATVGKGGGCGCY